MLARGWQGVPTRAHMVGTWNSLSKNWWYSADVLKKAMYDLTSDQRYNAWLDQVHGKALEGCTSL